MPDSIDDGGVAAKTPSAPPWRRKLVTGLVLVGVAVGILAMALSSSAGDPDNPGWGFVLVFVVVPLLVILVSIGLGFLTAAMRQKAVVHPAAAVAQCMCAAALVATLLAVPTAMLGDGAIPVLTAELTVIIAAVPLVFLNGRFPLVPSLIALLAFDLAAVLFIGIWIHSEIAMGADNVVSSHAAWARKNMVMPWVGVSVAGVFIAAACTAAAKWQSRPARTAGAR